MKTTKTAFYDQYHAKNRNTFYFKVISDNNFTYFYTLKYLRSILASFNKKTVRILDLGCGVGTVDFYLAQKGHNVTGIDISADAIKICNSVKEQFGFENTRFIEGDVQKKEFKQKFDFIICSEVIEHVEDDRGLLKTIHKLLVPGGILLLTTPSKYAPLHRLGFLKDFDQRVGHLRRYDMPDLLSKIQEAGFDIRETDRAESIIRNGLYTFKPLGYLIKLIRGPLIPLFHVIDDFFTTIFGESDLAVIAKKI